MKREISYIWDKLKFMDSFGDILFDVIGYAKGGLFLQGEIAQLTYQAFSNYIQVINETKDENIEVTYPVGFTPSNTPITTTHSYTKQDIISRYQYLGFNQLPINGIYQLVTIMESLFGDILRKVLLQFPNKIPNKRKLDYDLVLEAKSLDEIKGTLVNIVINELAYKSPKEFAEEFYKYVGINFLEKPTFHKYIELKATRDIYIHNQGIANDIYITKAVRLSRVKVGQFLPVDIQYFLQSYESCLQINEILEEELNKIWPSVKFQEKGLRNITEQKEDAIENAIEIAEKHNEERNLTRVTKKVAKNTKK